MRTTDEKNKKMHALYSLGFYMAVCPVEQKQGLRPSAFCLLPSASATPLFEKLKH